MGRLYERFLDDPIVYQACVRFWEQRTTSIAHSVDSVADWRSWIPRTYADGTVIGHDGNPIWDGRSSQLGRAYRIIQDRSKGTGLEIAAWLRSYEEQYIEMPRCELFIHLCLTEESLSIAETLLRKWMSPATTVDDMATSIAEEIPSDSSARDRM